MKITAYEFTHEYYNKQQSKIKNVIIIKTAY